MAGCTTFTDVHLCFHCWVCAGVNVYTLGLFTSLLWTPTVTQSPELLTDVWRCSRTQTCCFCVFSPYFPFHPLCCTTPTQPESLRNSAVGGLGTSGHRAIFSRGLHKHTRPRKNVPLTGGNHGNWHWPQGPVSRYPSARNHTRSPADARRAAKTEVLAFRGRCGFSGGPLIDWRETERPFLWDAPDEC